VVLSCCCRLRCLRGRQRPTLALLLLLLLVVVVVAC
jgi:hypothetical protein